MRISDWSSDVCSSDLQDQLSATEGHVCVGAFLLDNQSLEPAAPDDFDGIFGEVEILDGDLCCTGSQGVQRAVQRPEGVGAATADQGVVAAGAAQRVIAAAAGEGVTGPAPPVEADDATPAPRT